MVYIVIILFTVILITGIILDILSTKESKELEELNKSIFIRHQKIKRILEKQAFYKKIMEK